MATRLDRTRPELLIPLESRASRVLVLLGALALAGGLASAVLRPAVAASLAARAGGIDALERALAWDRADPILHLGLGSAYQHIGDYRQARRHFETATRLRPTDGVPWLQQALLADREGDRPRARQAVEAALRLDPHNVMIRWEAALLAMRWGERDSALEHLRYVLAVDPSQRDAAFQLARLLLEPEQAPSVLLPGEPRALTNVLLAAVQNQDASLAHAAWARRATLEPAVPTHVGRQYVEFLLASGDGRGARAAWHTLVANGHADADNLVWNGGFEGDRLTGWGFDWRVTRVWGVDVTLDRVVAARGRHSLRLAFNSFPSLNFAGLEQPVAVEPGREYRLSALARASDLTTRSGLKLQVVLPGSREVLAETPTVAGTTDGWLPLETRVRVPETASLVQVRLRREPAAVPEGNLGGKVWLDEVRLQ